MPWIVQSLSLSVSLAMDAFAVSLTNGLSDKKMKGKRMLLIACSFGLFQGVMPLLGYLFGSIFEKWISVAIPIIGFVILSFLGGKMIYEGVKKEDGDCEKNDTCFCLRLLLMQSIATSIDAFTVGFVYIGAKSMEVFTTFLLIAVVTAILCYIAIYIGKKFGDTLKNKAGIFGGVILCVIGLKILIEFLITLF